MAKRLKGSKVLVKLPFGTTTAATKASGSKKGKPGKSQLVLMHPKVAKELKFTVVTNRSQSVTFKTASGNVTVNRIVSRGCSRRKSCQLFFETEKTIDGIKFKSVNVQMPSGTTVIDFVNYFTTGGGKTLKLAKLITPDGKTHSLSDGT